jgi:hypothetical protein
MPLGSERALGLAGPYGTPLIGALPAPADPAGGVSCAKACPGRYRLPSTARTSAVIRDIRLSGNFNNEVGRGFPQARRLLRLGMSGFDSAARASASPLRDPAHARNGVGVYCSNEGGRKVKTAIVALSAAILISATPAALARNVSSKTPDQHHQVSKKHPPNISGYAPWRVHANGAKTSYPGAPAYVPSTPKDYTYDNSRNGGGGGGGGGGSGM